MCPNVPKPTKEELAYWENILNPGRKPAQPTRNKFQTVLDPDTPDLSGPALPARPSRNGGLLWRERIFTNWGKQERKKRPRVPHVCPTCGLNFEATARAVFCSYRCKDRIRKRRARSVPRNLPIHSEEQ